MSKLGDGRYGLAGSSCVSRPTCTQDHPDAPLMYAITYALGYGDQIDSYLKGVLPPYPTNSLGGGDPGWLWYHIKSPEGEDLVVVEIDDVVAPPDGIWNEYSEEKVKYEIRAALNNLAIQEPSRLNEVDKVIRRYNLLDVVAPPGLVSMPHWDGLLPNKWMTNSD